MSSGEVLLIERDGPVAVLTLNRPRQKNALDAALIKALGAALASVSEDAAVRAVVLTGSGGAFCAGADLKSGIAEGPNLLEQLEKTIDTYHVMIRAIASAPKPVVAMIEGGAVGFGCDLALACDLRVMAEGAYLQEKFVKIGLMPDGGGTFWLPRLVGLARAMEMMMLGEPVAAERAVSMGLANRAFPVSEIREETMKLAHALAKGPPLAYAEMKQAVRASFGGTIDAALDREKAGQLRCLTSSDCMEGVLSWMQKREPVFQGR